MCGTGADTQYLLLSLRSPAGFISPSSQPLCWALCSEGSIYFHLHSLLWAIVPLASKSCPWFFASHSVRPSSKVTFPEGKLCNKFKVSFICTPPWQHSPHWLVLLASLQGGREEGRINYGHIPTPTICLLSKLGGAHHSYVTPRNIDVLGALLFLSVEQRRKYPLNFIILWQFH